MLNKYSTTYEVLERKPDIAIVPIGSLEQHGPHLPISTDTLIVERVSEELAERLNAFLMPCLPYSSSIEHKGFAGTVWLSPETLALVIKDIVKSLLSQGFEIVVLVNGHGGNFVLKVVTRSINLESNKVRVILVNVAEIMAKLAEGDLHAGDVETSLMLYLYPNLVRKTSPKDFVPKLSREFIDYLGFKGLCKNGIWGWPSRGSRERGEQYFRTIVDSALKHIYQVLECIQRSQ